MTLGESNNCTLTWQPPVIAKRHGHILEYFANCSSQSFDEDQTLNTNTTVALLILRSHTVYNCCALAVNEIGLGDPACQTVVTYESGIMYGTIIMNHMQLVDCLQRLISYNLHMM